MILMIYWLGVIAAFLFNRYLRKSGFISDGWGMFIITLAISFLSWITVIANIMTILTEDKLWKTLPKPPKWL